MEPIVTIAITTYNLESYIGECLESILRQDTEYPYEILIADDCSTDNTVGIIREYKEKYPDTIILLTTPTNLGSLKNSNRLFRRIKTKYFTFIDGDDYWLNEKHLQIQVDFLESHPEYVICAGNNKRLIDGHIWKDEVNEKYLNKAYSFSDYLNGTMPFFHTSTIMCRNVLFVNGLPDCFIDAEDTFENCALRGEDFRRILHLEKGPLFALSKDLSVYRIHSKGIWSGKTLLKRYIESTIGFHFYYKYYDNKYGNSFQKKFEHSLWSLLRKIIIRRLKRQEIKKDEKLLLGQFMEDLNHCISYNERTYNLPGFRLIYSIIKRIIS